MKNILKFSLLFFSLLLMTACEDEDKNPFQTSEFATGAVLRTISFPSRNIDLEVPATAKFSVEVEFFAGGNPKDNALLESVNVFIRYRDLSPINGTNNIAEIPFATIPASAFTVAPTGFPRTTITVGALDAIAAFGLDLGTQVSSGDIISVRLSLKLTTGQVFTTTSVSGDVSGGRFFSSPFGYDVNIKSPCFVFTQSIFDGDFEVSLDEWADYAPGDLVPVIPGDAPNEIKILSTNNPFIANPGTSWITLTVDPVTFAVTAASNENFDYGPGFVLAVSGTGEVNSCVGTIDVTLNFGAFTGNRLVLRKKL